METGTIFLAVGIICLIIVGIFRFFAPEDKEGEMVSLKQKTADMIEKLFTIAFFIGFSYWVIDNTFTFGWYEAGYYDLGLPIIAGGSLISGLVYCLFVNLVETELKKN